MKKHVSVILPAFNCERYLGTAIESVLSQSHREFTLIVLDNGSTDSTAEIANEYRNIDSRVQVHSHTEGGLVGALNRGLELAEGDYIARMDGDDICLPERFERQVELMERKSDVVVCGTDFETFGEGRASSVIAYAPGDEALRAHMMFYNALRHSSCLFRGVTFRKYTLRYDKNFQHAEDYDLFMRLQEFGKLENIPVVGIRYRTHFQSVCHTNSGEQDRNADRLRERYLKSLGLNPTPEQVKCHNLVSRLKIESTIEFLETLRNWFREILDWNLRTGTFSRDVLTPLIAEFWYLACYRSTSLGPTVLTRFLSLSRDFFPSRSIRSAYGQYPSKFGLGKFVVKSILRKS